MKSCLCLGKPLCLNGPNLTLPYLYIPSDRLGGCNILTHGKAVLNNKEYGCHLLAQPNGSNVHATSLKYLIKTKCTKPIHRNDPLVPNLTVPYPYTLFDKLGVCNKLTEGKAVFKNEYGFQLIAQSDGSNVHETSLLYPNKSKSINHCTKITILRKVLLDFSGKYVREDNIRHRSYIMTASTNLYTGEGNESSGLLFPPTRNDNRPLIPLISNVTSQLHREIQKVNSYKPPSFLKGNSYLFLSRLYICQGSCKLHSFLKEIALATLNTKYGG